MFPDDKKLQLEKLRADVDVIDKKLAAILDSRMEKSSAIGLLKKELGMDLHSPDREKYILNNITAVSLEFISSKSLKKIFRIIIDESLALQAREYEERNSDEE